MKKSSKFISMLLAVLMAASCFSGLSVFTASAAEGDTKVYFEVPTLEDWGTTKQVFCHVYTVYGHKGEPLTVTAWQAKSELCKKDAATGLYYFDTSKIGTIEEGADYALLFSTKDTEGNSHQTGNITLGKECLGDTVYLTGGMTENTEDSTKMDYEAAWRNNSDKFGAKAALTSTGKIIGKYFPANQPKSQIVSQFLFSWAVLNESIITPELVADICTQIGAEPMDVYNQYAADYAEQLADPENNPTVAPLTTIATLLNVDPTATTAEPTEPTEPATTEPATTEPVTTEPVTTEPVTTEPVTTEPVTTEPVTTEPVTTEPVTTEPVTTEPVTTEPVTTEPVTTEPVTTEPVTTEPVTTEPDPTEPAGDYPVYVVAGFSNLCGVEWQGSATEAPENVMTAKGDGTYEKVYTDVAVNDGYSVKVVENTAEGTLKWIGVGGVGDDALNFVFNVTSVCDVTVTFDPATNKIDVTGTGVVVPTGLDVKSVTAVGNAEEGDVFLNGMTWKQDAAVNHMTEVAPNVYEITYTGVETPEEFAEVASVFKFAINDSWTDSFGGVFEGFGVESDAVYNGKDMEVCFPVGVCDVTLKLDLSNFDFATKKGAKFTVSAVKQTPEGPMIGDVDGDGEITIKDATMIQKLALGIGYPEDFQEIAELMAIADTNGDGLVTIVDVTLVQKYIVGGYNNTGLVGVVAVG